MKLRVGDNNNIFFSTEKSHAVCIFPFFFICYNLIHIDNLDLLTSP